MPYLGNIPATQFAELKYQDFTGGTGTSFTLNDPVGSAQELEVFVNNVRQEPGVAYTVSGTALTMTGSIVATDDFYVVFQGKSTGTATHPAGQALTATDGTFTGNLDVSSGTIKLDGNYPTGTNNVALGDAALGGGSLSGGFNVAIGTSALDANTSGTTNIAIGVNALGANTTASDSVAVGHSALKLNTTGAKNVAVGYEALDANSTADNNTAVGYGTLTSNTTGAGNNAFGYSALFSNTTGSNNTSVGTNALDNNTTASNNTAVGHQSLGANTTASGNTALGYEAGKATTTGAANTFLGYRAGFTSTDSPANTILGYRAGETNSSSTGYNVFVGNYAGYSNTSGHSNCFVGARSGGLAAGYYVTTGNKNTIIGGYNGNQGGLDIRTSSNNIVLSDGDGNPRIFYNDSKEFKVVSPKSGGSAANTFVFECTGSNPQGLRVQFTNASDDDNNEDFLRCLDSATTRFIVTNQGDVQNHDNAYGSTSDQKLKEQITDASSQWDDIKALTVRKYKMKLDVTEKGDSDDLWRLGVVAQEVETAGMSGLITENIDRDDDGNDLGTRTKVVKYSILYMKAVKALQEAMDRIETLETKVAALEAE